MTFGYSIINFSPTTLFQFLSLKHQTLFPEQVDVQPPGVYVQKRLHSVQFTSRFIVH